MAQKKWATGGDLVSAFKNRAVLQPDRMAVLSAVWDRELGHFSSQWKLAGVKRGVLIVQPRSAAAAQELQLRAASIVRGLNKHFSRPWIKAVKTTLG